MLDRETRREKTAHADRVIATALDLALNRNGGRVPVDQNLVDAFVLRLLDAGIMDADITDLFAQGDIDLMKAGAE